MLKQMESKISFCFIFWRTTLFPWLQVSNILTRYTILVGGVMYPWFTNQGWVPKGPSLRGFCIIKKKKSSFLFYFIFKRKNCNEPDVAENLLFYVTGRSFAAKETEHQRAG